MKIFKYIAKNFNGFKLICFLNLFLIKKIICINFLYFDYFLKLLYIYIYISFNWHKAWKINYNFYLRSICLIINFLFYYFIILKLINMFRMNFIFNFVFYILRTFPFNIIALNLKSLLYHCFSYITIDLN